MERDPLSSSYTTFPDNVSCNGVTYKVVGSFVKKYNDSNTLAIETTGDLKLIFDIGDDIATIKDYEPKSTTDKVSVTFPEKVTYVDDTGTTTSYVVEGVYGNTSFTSAPIENLTVIVSDDDYALIGSFMPGNTSLTSLKFIVDNDNTANEGKVKLQKGTFLGCTSLTTLTLPNVLKRCDYAFAGCINLGSENTCENPFVFNTMLPLSQQSNYMFSGCTGLKYIELGPNVNKISTIFGPYSSGSYSGCSNIKVIYNANTIVPESDIGLSILESGSHNVLLFNNPGGTFTKGAIITGSDGTISNITMPEGTYGGVDIPSWSHKDGTARFDSGEDYASFNPWGTANTAYSYYYYALYGTCTVTYHVWYKDNNVVQSEVQTQTVVCMYNTKLYDGSTYPNESLREKFDKDSYWMVSDSEYGDFSYSCGEALTLYTDLDLIGYFDGVDSETSKGKTLTLKWDYIDTSLGTPTVKTYSKAYTFSNYSGTLPSVDTFCADVDITDATMKSLVGKRATEPNGRAYLMGDTFKFFCDLTLTIVSTTDAYKLVCYTNSEMNVNRFFLNYTAVNVVVAAPNMFHYSDETQHFTYWSLNDASGTKCYPGDLVTYVGNPDTVLYAKWESNDSKVSVTYNLYESDSGYKSETGTYTYGNSVELPTDSTSEFSRQGYKLIGWSYTPTQNVNFPLDVPVKMRSNLRLYAVWEEEPPTVITDNLLVSKENAKGDYDFKSIFIGNLAENDEVQYTVTFLKGENPTEVGVYTVQIGYKVLRNGADVTKEYYSGYDGTNPVTYQCYTAFLTIYSGDHATVTD